jgi:hypothetical protein
MTRRTIAVIGGMLLLVLLLPATAFAGEWAQCPGSTGPVTEPSITISDDNTRVTASFKVAAGCTQLPVSLVTYGLDPATSKPRLKASTTGTFDGSDAVVQLETAGPGCSVWADLVSGLPEPEPEPEPECPAEPEFRVSVDAETIKTDGRRAVATFEIDEGCENVELSLVNFVFARSGRVLGDNVTGTFDAGKHTLTVDVADNCWNTTVLALGKPDRSFDRLYERVLVSEGDIEGRTSCPVAGVADDGEVVSGTPARTGYLPFTGADALPLMVIGATLLALGGALLVTTRRRLPARR